MKRVITIEHDGTTYYGDVMRIKSTMLGYEDHGILTAQLYCEGDGCGVAVGGFCLDNPSDGPGYDRRGTAYGLDHLIRIMETVGVSSWEALAGKDVVVLRESEHGWGSVSVGVAGLLNDRVLILKEHAEVWRDCEGVAS